MRGHYYFVMDVTEAQCKSVSNVKWSKSLCALSDSLEELSCSIINIKSIYDLFYNCRLSSMVC